MVKTATIIAMTAVIVAGLGHAAMTAAADEHKQGRPAFEHVHSLAFDAAGRSLWLGAQWNAVR